MALPRAPSPGTRGASARLMGAPLGTHSRGNVPPPEGAPEPHPGHETAEPPGTLPGEPRFPRMGHGRTPRTLPGEPRVPDRRDGRHAQNPSGCAVSPSLNPPGSLPGEPRVPRMGDGRAPGTYPGEPQVPS